MSTKNVTLNVKTFWCNKTTEHGEDEVYFVVGGKKTDGSVVKTKVPNSGEYSLNDHGGNNQQSLEVRHHTTPTLWSGNLEDGESVDLTVMIMEGDNSDAGKALEVAGEAGSQSDPNGGIVGTIADIAKSVGKLLMKNTDDFPGAFAVRITNDHGNIKTNWQVKERCIDRGADANGKIFHFVGDGSIYFGTFGVN